MDLNLGGLWVTLGVDASGLNAAEARMKAFQASITSSTGNISRDLERTSNEFQRFGSAASRYLTLPLALIGGASIKAASDLEFVTQKIVALAGVSQSQMDAWQSSISRISEETARSSKEIAETLYYTASAGLSNAKALEVTEVAAKGAAIGMGTAADIGRLLTYAMNAYGESAYSATRLMDMLTVAVREGTAEASTMVSVIGDIVPVASAMGVGFDEVVGSLAALTRTGFNAAKAATSLRQIMVTLLNPTEEAKKAMDYMAKANKDATISAQGFRDMIKDKGLIETLVKISNLSKQFGDSVSGIVFGNVRALTGDLSLTGKNLKAVLEVMQMTKNELGAFQYAFGLMTGTMQFKMQQVKIAVNRAFIELGNSMRGPIIEVMAQLRDLIISLTDWWKSLSASTQLVIVKFGIFLAAIGPVMLAVAAAIKIYAGFIMVIRGVGIALEFMSLNLLAAPWIPVAAGILLFAAALLMVGQNLDSINVKYRTLAKVMDEANASVAREQTQINVLVDIMKSENTTLEQKKAALISLQNINKQYLGDLTLEAVATNKAKNAIDDYILSVRNKNELEIATNKLIKENAEYMESVSTGKNRELSGGQKVLNFMTYGAFSEDMGEANAIEQKVRHAIVAEQLKRRIEELTKALQKQSDAEKDMASFEQRLQSARALWDKEIQNEIDFTEAKKSAYDKYIEEMEIIRKKTVLFGLDNTKLGGDFDALGATIQNMRARLIELLKEYDAGSPIVVEFTNKIKELQERSMYKATDTKKMVSPWQRWKTMWTEDAPTTQFIDNTWKSLGGGKEVFDYKQFIDPDKLKPQISTSFNEVLKIYQDWQKDVSKNENKQISTGRGNSNPWKQNMDDLKAEIEATKKLKDNAAKGSGDATMYNQKLEKLMKPIKFKESMQKINAYVQEVGNGLNSLISSWVSYIDMQQNKALSMIEATAKAENKSAEWVAKKKEQIDDIYNKKKQRAAIATAIINGAMAVTNIIANVPGSVLNPLSWVAIGMAAATTAAQVAVIRSQGMAEGGIVPSGYPNDSYPARLTSGEVVIPPNKLSSIQGQGGGEYVIHLVGKLVAEGPDMVYIVDKQYKLQKSY